MASVTAVALFTVLCLHVAVPELSALEVGDQCPEFSLEASDGQTYSSKDFVGRVPVVIAWFPKAFTGGCTRECLSLQESSQSLGSYDVLYFAASVDDVETNTRFAASLGVSFPILADPWKLAASAFGVVDEEQPRARRWTFYIGADGFVRHIDKSIDTANAGRQLAGRMAGLGFPEKPDLPNVLSESEKAAGWRLLFNGRDTSQWMTEMRWATEAPVDRDAILASNSGGSMVLFSEPFEDFELSVDVLMESEFSNSGIFIRMSDLNDPFPSSFEIQVVGAGGGGYSGFGSVLDLAPSGIESFDPKVWNRVLVRADGPAITTFVNGRQTAFLNTAQFTEDGLRPDGSRHKYGVVSEMPRRGYLGFQDLDSKVWFRNIRIREIPR